jgi:hypothetical protein
MPRKPLHHAVLLTCLTISVSCAWMREVFSPAESVRTQGTPVALPPISLEGPVIRAVTVAANDFMALRQSEVPPYPDAGEPKHAMTGAGDEGYAIGRCLSRLENYDVRIHETEDRFLIHFQPNIDRCTGKPGERIFGGDSDYEVSKKDFTVMKRDFGE